MMGEKDRRWRNSVRTLLASAVAASTIGGVVVVAGPAVSAFACGTHGKGAASFTNQTNSIVTLHTTWFKKPPGCLDFNLTYTNPPEGASFDLYRGYYKSGSTWIGGSNGWHKFFMGSHGDFALVTNVATGTELTVGEYYGSNYVEVDY